MEKILDRFLRYVAVDTQSDENSASQPSTSKQLNLLRMLRDELEAMGTGALRKAVLDGDLEEGCFIAGQSAAMVSQVQPAADIVREVMEAAEPILKGAAKWVK